MKAQKTPVASATQSAVTSSVTFSTEFTSIKNACYSFANASDYASKVAQYILEKCPTFLKEIPKAVDAELSEGFALKKQELRDADSKIARRYNSEWIPDPKGNIEVTIAYAMSYSQQEFGRMRIAEPVKHGVLKAVRNDWSKYRHAQFKLLVKAIKDLNPETKEKAPNKDFNTFIVDTMQSILDKAKSVSARKTEKNFDEVKVRMAVEAFRKVWNAK